MPHFTTLATTVWQFFSPNSNKPALTSKPSVPQTPESVPRNFKDQLDRRSMSPTSRINSWKANLMEETSPSSATGNKRKLSPSEILTPMSIDFRERKKVKLSPRTSNPDESEISSGLSSPPSFETAEDESTLIETGEDANEKTIVVETYTPPSAQAINTLLRYREAEVAALTHKGWPTADVAVFRKLHLRGFEPLMPYHWEMDFRVLPVELFTKDDGRAFIKALGLDGQSGADFRATRAFDELLGSGPRIRDRLLSNLPAEIAQKKAIHAYVRWTLRDAGLWKRKPYLPILTVISGSRKTKSDVLLQNATKKLDRLARKWSRALSHDAAAELPPLYAVILTHTAMGFTSYIPGHTGDSGPSLRTIALFNWAAHGTDVWNAFAVAILAVHCRNVLVEALQGRELRGVKLQEEGDPDA